MQYPCYINLLAKSDNSKSDDSISFESEEYNEDTNQDNKKLKKKNSSEEFKKRAIEELKDFKVSKCYGQAKVFIYTNSKLIKKAPQRNGPKSPHKDKEKEK